MFNVAKKLVGIAGLAALLLLAGCDDTARYTVKAFSSGNPVGDYQARSLSVDSYGAATFLLAEGGRSVLLNGTYAVHRIDLNSPSQSPLVYHATLYSGGKVQDTFDSSSLTSYRDRVSLLVNSEERAVFAGTYVVHHIGANIDGTPDSARYKVTLYNDGVTVGTWFADSTSTSQNGALVLKINGIDSALTIAGQYKVEQIR